MFWNIVKITLRNLSRHKGYSIINITGLAVGMACCILILLWVQYELGHENFHANLDNLYRVYQKIQFTGDRHLLTDNTPGPLAADVKQELAEVEEAARFIDGGSKIVRYGDTSFNERGLRLVDQSFLAMFTFPLKAGDPMTCLSEPYSMIMTEETARKYFGDEDPIGKTVVIDNRYGFSVTGVLESVPRNTHLRFDILVPFSNSEELVGSAFDRYNSNWPLTYLQLRSGTDAASLEPKLQAALADNISETGFHLQPVSRIKLYSLTGQPSFIIVIYIFSCIALFILLIACINFMNLSTARAGRRTKEVGLRKVLGAYRGNLIRQFLSESILMSMAALFVALLLVELFIPMLNGIVGTQLRLELAGNRSLLFVLVAITLATGIVSGGYPAFYLSSFQPVATLKGSVGTPKRGSRFRNILVLFQFTMSIVLIIATIVVYRQLDYMRNKELGYASNDLVYVMLRGDSGENYETLKNELLRSGAITHVTSVSKLPISGGDSSGSWIWDGKDPEYRTLMNRVFVDNDYIETMGIVLAGGRNFMRQNRTSAETGTFEYLVNEEAERKMNVESAVGMRFGLGAYDGTIVGVVKDYHFSHLGEEIEPIVLVCDTRIAAAALLRIDPVRTAEAIEALESAWKDVNPMIPLNYDYLDGLLTRLYENEQRLGELFRVFAGLAIVIACLGLFGLTSYAAESRTREIGIRKVLGASVQGIVILIAKEFIRWVIIANLIACPIAFIAMHGWLRDFSYRISLSPLFFLMAGATVLLLSFATSVVQVLRAATINPVKVLRYE